MKTTIRKFIGTLLTISITTLAFSSVATAKNINKQKNSGVSDDIVLQWNEIAYKRLPSGPPHPTARFMATVQLAVFEAVNAITGKYHPYL